MKQCKCEYRRTGVISFDIDDAGKRFYFFPCEECGGIIPKQVKEEDKARAFFYGKCDCKNLERKKDGVAYICTRCGRRAPDHLVKKLEYNRYMSSDRWREIREKILLRSQICEGCLSEPATEVHHRHYKQFGNEFLFDLMGLCISCHNRIHEVWKKEKELEMDLPRRKWRDPRVY